MCGIGGVKRMGASPILPEHLQILAASLMWRGRDATGVALMQPSGEIKVFKRAVEAIRFIGDSELTAFLQENLPTTLTALVHTRAKTKGTPHKNENNHPLFAGEGAVVHNGHIWNDDALFTETGFARKAETDTDILRAMVDAAGLSPNLVELLNKTAGSAACAFLHPSEPKSLLLARSGNPLMVGASDDLLFWASTKDALFRASPQWTKRFGVDMQLSHPALSHIPMADDTAWLFGEKGLEWHLPLRIAGKYRPPLNPKLLPIAVPTDSPVPYRVACWKCGKNIVFNPDQRATKELSPWKCPYPKCSVFLFPEARKGVS